MNLTVIGTNHKFSPIKLRERLSFSKRALKDALFILKEYEKIFRGAVILSTCNRIEIYATGSYQIVRDKLIDFIASYHEISKKEFLPYLYVYEGKEAIRHLFRVTCGLDSLILGETQICGQVREAYLETKMIAFADSLLAKIFEQALNLAGIIHRETRISEGKVSAGSVTLDFIKRRLGSLLDKNILIIGAGKVTGLVLRYLKREKPRVVFVANRRFERAKILAGQINGIAVRFDRLKEFLNNADVLITATASPHFIITKDTLESIGDRRLLIVDLALPRDVDPLVKEIKGVELFCLEDLAAIIEENTKRKQREAEYIEKIIDMEVRRVWEGFIVSEREKVLLH